MLQLHNTSINGAPDGPPACQAFFLCYTGTRVKGLSFQYSRTKPPFGLISIRVTFLCALTDVLYYKKYVKV